MSEFLFPHSRLDPRVLRLRLAAVGLSASLVVGLACAVLGLQTIGVLSSDLRITVQLPTVGDTLGINSDVKYNGLRVGRVVEVDPITEDGADGWTGATAEVLVEEEHAQFIPAAVAARVLPGTLFGNEYVDFVVPGSNQAPAEGATTRPAATTRAAASGTGAAPYAADARIADGDVIPADTSVQTLRLMDTFEATQRLLAVMDPAQWDVALSQLADALDGKGDDLGQMVRDGNDVLARWTALQPQVEEDMDLLTSDLDLLADIEPQLVSALRDTRPLARTLVEREEETATLLQAVPAILDGEDGVTAFLMANGTDTARLLNATAANLEVFAERYPSFALMLQKVPALLRNGANAVKNGNIQMEGVLSPTFVGEYDQSDCPSYRGLYGSCGGGDAR